MTGLTLAWSLLLVVFRGSAAPAYQVPEDVFVPPAWAQECMIGTHPNNNLQTLSQALSNARAAVADFGFDTYEARTSTGQGAGSYLSVLYGDGVRRNARTEGPSVRELSPGLPDQLPRKCLVEGLTWRLVALSTPEAYIPSFNVVPQRASVAKDLTLGRVTPDEVEVAAKNATKVLTAIRSLDSGKPVSERTEERARIAVKDALNDVLAYWKQSESITK